MLKQEYQRYLNSAAWQKIRQRRLALATGRCEYTDGDGVRCQATSDLNVHHRNYLSVGAETDADLEVLCKLHHLLHHVVTAECDVCGADIHDDEDDALAFIHQTAEEYGVKYPTLEMLGLTRRPSHDTLLCWYCSDKLSGDE